MAADLDRAYVINGDDLRIALTGADGSGPLVPNPRDVAEFILGRIEVRGAVTVSRKQLTSAFARPSVRIAIDKFSARDGDDYTEGHVRYPQVAADQIIAALREIGPWAEDGDVVDAHICCEHADGPGPFSDPEIVAIAAILAAMDPVPDEGDTTTSGAPWRVLAYIALRYGFVLCTED